MAKKIIEPPPRAPCVCTSFCLEDTARTGRFCKLKYPDAAKKAARAMPAAKRTND